MKVLSLSTATIFSAFLASSARALGAAATIIEHEENQKSYLRQNPLFNPNDLIATSDSDAADSSSTTAKWLFTDEEEAIELGQDATTGGTNWKLDGCCGRFETIFLSCFAAYLVVIKLLWNTFIMKPMKLVAVFVHEFGHATACWLTGGKVHGIEVYTNEGGVTKYSGGARWFVIPAGYLGGAFWGAVFVVMSGDRWASLSIAIIFCVGMAVSLFFAPNATMVGLNIGFIVLTVAFILVDQLAITPFLQFLTLFYGVFIGIFSVYDIWDDLITRTVEGSDAHACHKLIPCCLPRCVGVQFAVVALAFQALGLYLALVWMSSGSA
ncbi:metallopeptidase (family M50) [Skeletonema marinoi]|uniref:Metallopeptidase (Family M50) n=1 Tax=Skeletonema marinoi TaxID=267567 RepID=A0AAD9DCP4_9STRA|nr:metallopeptidase (family M50) [Skeletonema marinoi]